jgi:hypothetical protein
MSRQGCRPPIPAARLAPAPPPSSQDATAAAATTTTTSQLTFQTKPAAVAIEPRANPGGVLAPRFCASAFGIPRTRPHSRAYGPKKVDEQASQSPACRPRLLPAFLGTGRRRDDVLAHPRRRKHELQLRVASPRIYCCLIAGPGLGEVKLERQAAGMDGTRKKKNVSRRKRSGRHPPNGGLSQTALGGHVPRGNWAWSRAVVCWW